MKAQFVIPDFKSFCDELSKIFAECEDIDGGANASYIPQLERYDPKLFTVSVCTVDGQQFTIGDKGKCHVNNVLSDHYFLRYLLHRTINIETIHICSRS